MLALVFAPFLLLQPAQAATVNITGGITTVDVTADLAGLGLGAAAFGTASLSGSTFTFPISGGTVDTATGNAIIEHTGVGVALFAGTTAATVGNFVIDTAAATIRGNVNGGSAFVDLFTLGPATTQGIEVLFASPLAGALSQVFGAPDLTGATFGFANTAPATTPVPLPAAMPLLLAGLGAFGALRLRRRMTQA
jgi:hypothetical protein